MRLILFALGLAGAGISCDDPPAAPDTDVARIDVDPSALVFDALGASSTLSARALNASGSEVPAVLAWTSSDPAVARVDRDGVVTSVGNGSATLAATSGAASATVGVEVAQVFAGTDFVDLPLALLDGEARTITVALVDRLGQALRSESGPLTLGPGDPLALSLGGSLNADMMAGRAVFDDVVFQGLGYEHHLVATTPLLRGESQPFDVVAAFDQVSVLGTRPPVIGLLVDGVSAGSLQNDLPFVAQQSPVDIGAFRGILDGEVVGFGNGRAPAIQSARWTDDADLIELILPDPVVVDLAIWIVHGPFAEQAAWADQAVERTRVIWEAERYGVEIGNVEVIDATANPEASRFFEFNGCGERANAQTAIGRRQGSINIYYVERVDGGADRGRNCPVGGEFIVMAERSGDELLSHEIGHSFGLIHTDGLTTQFDRTNVMHSASSTRQFLTEAQTFRTHFDNGSILHLALQHLGRGPVRSCPGLAGTPFCPPIQMRLWPDGAFAATPPTQSRTRLVAASRTSGGRLVNQWLGTDCMLEENTDLDSRMRAMGDTALEALAEVAQDPNAPAVRRVRAVRGIGLFAEDRATVLLGRFVATSVPGLREEAAYQLRSRR